MNLHPNPTMQNVTFDMKYGNNALVKIHVINNLGQIISTQNISVQKEKLHSKPLIYNRLLQVCTKYVFLKTDNL
jgi:hypothetical protein